MKPSVYSLILRNHGAAMNAASKLSMRDGRVRLVRLDTGKVTLKRPQVDCLWTNGSEQGYWLAGHSAGMPVECRGHEPEGGMAQTFYCDGSCRLVAAAPRDGSPGYDHACGYHD